MTLRRVEVATHSLVTTHGAHFWMLKRYLHVQTKLAALGTPVEATERYTRLVRCDDTENFDGEICACNEIPQDAAFLKRYSRPTENDNTKFRQRT